MASRFVPEDSILSEYTNVTEVLPEETVAKPTTDKFHRPDPETSAPKPACGIKRKDDDWDLFDTSSALSSTVEPCRGCFEPILQYLATDADSPVEYREGHEPVETDTPDPTGQRTDGGEGKRSPTLVTRTEKVALSGGSRSKYHAPTLDGTVCGLQDVRVVGRETVVGHYEPCQHCFSDLGEEAGINE